MIIKIGTKVYYCTNTGNVIKIIGDMVGFVKETSFDEDYEIYAELNERNRESIGLLTFNYGEYSNLSSGSTGVRVNLETKELEFSYDDFPIFPEEPSEIDVLHEKVNTLETKQAGIEYALMMGGLI